MSLVGRLEDLGLGEILQIVALSGKSGILNITSHGKSGKIFFNKGKVTRAFSDAYRVNIGDLLVKNGHATPESIRSAVERQRSQSPPEMLGTILIRDFGVLKAHVEECVITLIENAVFSLFRWHDGEFQFQLSDEFQQADISIDFLQYDLSHGSGLNPQFLAMEGSRIVDESRKEDAEATAAPPAEAVPAAPPTAGAASGAEAPSTVLIVDTFTLFRTALERLLGAKGFTVHAVETVAEGRQIIAASGGKPLLVITSLLLPREGGDGMLGGLDIIDALPADGSMRAVIVADYRIPEAEERLHGRSFVKVLKKPRFSELTRDNVKQEMLFFMKTLEPTVAELYGYADQEQSSRSEAGWDADIKQEFQISEGGKVTTTPGLTLLKSMLSELSEAASGNEIILMILRLASEIMPRGVVFAVRHGMVAGLGQFGLEPFVPQPHKMVRGLSLHLAGKAADVIETGIAYKGAPPSDEFMAAMTAQLGGTPPSEVFMSAISSGGRGVVLFYGDNLPGGTPIYDTDALDIFFAQAGTAMERMLKGQKSKEDAQA